MDLSKLTYASSGVSIKAASETNKKLIKKLKELGMKAEGWFSGIVDVSKFKGQNAFLDIAGCSISHSPKGIKESGRATAEQAINLAKGYPIGVLDYVAIPVMGDIVADFAEGVALASLERKCDVIGGESAEMKDTYKEGKLDAFVHVLSIRDNQGCDIADLIDKMEEPLVAATTDGTGTKTKIVRNPEDIIYHGFNDLGAQGVKPIAFAIYIAGNVSYDEMVEIDKKAENICKNLGVEKLKSIITRKTEDYIKGEVDIAGTVVGVIDKKELITGSKVEERDVIIGINVDGLMTNGYTLARNVCDELVKMGKVKSWDDPVEELNGKSFKYELSLPHRPMTDILFGYENIGGVLSKYKDSIKGMSHVTGSGQKGNIPRMIPDDYKAVGKYDVLPVPLFMELCRKYGIKKKELYRAFNMGVGFTIIASKEAAQDIINYINNNFRNRINGVDRQAAQIGVIELRKPGEEKFEFK